MQKYFEIIIIRSLHDIDGKCILRKNYADFKIFFASTETLISFSINLWSILINEVAFHVPMSKFSL